MRHLTVLRFIDDVGRSGSIRRTSERLNLTPSALTRRIQEFERELGVPVFERLPHGMRLNAAGELLVQYIRSQTADLERLKSRIADLSGVRRGHIAIACSQAFMDHVLPAEVEAYRAQFPAVTFLAQMRDHALGVNALTAFEVDLALLLHPPPAPDMEILLDGRQPLCALMRKDHPLARSSEPVRLRECFGYPVAMPDATIAIRHLLDAARTRTLQPMNMQLESGSLEFLRNYVMREQVVSFQVSIGIPVATPELHSRPVDERDMEPVAVVLGQLHGRRLSVAAAKFVDQLSKHPLWG
jgi:DNA-binding transcriptional LysR family regulator